MFMVFKYLTRVISASELRSTGSMFWHSGLICGPTSIFIFHDSPEAFYRAAHAKRQQDNGSKNCHRRTFSQHFAFGFSLLVSGCHLIIMRRGKAATDGHLLPSGERQPIEKRRNSSGRSDLKKKKKSCTAAGCSQNYSKYKCDENNNTRLSCLIGIIQKSGSTPGVDVRIRRMHWLEVISPQ